jgi:hypothetical protein
MVVSRIFRMQHLSATSTGSNPPPPAGTIADMILRHGADGRQVGTDWQFVGLGAFFGSDTEHA